MNRSARVWFLLVTALSVGAVSAAMTLGRKVLEEGSLERYVGDMAIVGFLFAAVSIAPSFVWYVVAAIRRRIVEMSILLIALVEAVAAVFYAFSTIEI